MPETFENQNLSLKQRKYFEKIFEILQIPVRTKKIPANLVVPLFKKSSLEISLWKQIWKLSCQNPNTLTTDEFLTCLKFITLAQNKIPLNHKNLEKTPNLNLPIFNDLNIVVSNFENLQDNSQIKKISAEEEYKILKQNIEKYKNLILKEQKNIEVQILSHNNAKKFFSSFNLHSSILSEIWKLCDLKYKGKLSPGELIISIHLIEIYKLQRTLPKKLHKNYLEFIKEFDLNLARNEKKEIIGRKISKDLSNELNFHYHH